MSVTSANRLELLQIAEAVAREKLIDPSLVIEAMEESLAKAARSRYGAEYDIRAHIDPSNGELTMERVRTVVEEVENDFTELTVADADEFLDDPKVGDEIKDSLPPMSVIVSLKNSKTALARSSMVWLSAKNTAMSSLILAGAKLFCAAIKRSVARCSAMEIGCALMCVMCVAKTVGLRFS